MTPQEQRLIEELFDRLANLETANRDPDAERTIIDGLRRAPNAAYALVQTVLLQNEALARANARIEELEDSAQTQQSPPGSFLNSMRDAVFGQGQSRGSVPNIRPSDTGAPRAPVWNSGQILNSGLNGGLGAGGYADPRNGGYAPPPTGYPGAGSGGGSFLGTAAAAAAGMIGGSILMSSIRGLMGGHQAFSDASAFGGDSRGTDSRGPWGGDQSSSDLARDAGVNDIGNSGSNDHDNGSQSLFDHASNDDRNDGDDDGFGTDGFDGGGSDLA